MTRKHYYIIAATTVVLAGGGYFGYEAVKFNKNENVEIKTEAPTENVTETEESTPTTSQEVKTYAIENINKKDGDVFAMPDTLTYTVSPQGATSRVKMLTTDGTVLFTGTSKATTPTFQIYPAGRYREGTKVQIIIDLLDGVEIKATKTVQVVL